MDTPAKKILILAANPKQTSRLRLDEEVRDIKEGLRLSQQRDKFILQQEWAVRPRDVRRAVLDFRPNIIHFSGHGAGTTGLSFEDETGKEKLVTSEALAGLFGQFAKQVECVVLNACYSEEQAVAIAQHIDYVIGMNAAIGDKAALEFAVGFYDALVAYDPRYDTYSRIEFAFNIACNAIQFAGISGDSIPIMKKKPHLGKVEEQPVVNLQDGSRLSNSTATANQDRLSERIIAQAQNLSFTNEDIAAIEARIPSHKEFVPSPDKAPEEAVAASQTETSAFSTIRPAKILEPERQKKLPLLIGGGGVVAAIIWLVSFSTINKGQTTFPNPVKYEHVTLSNFTINSQRKPITVSPEESINASANYVYDCPGCGAGSINQILVGIGGQDKPACIYNGSIKGKGSADFTLIAPKRPGTYNIFFRYAQAFGCQEAINNWWKVDGSPEIAESTIGQIIVK